MGGISTAVSKVTGFNYINMQNPASYAGISLTTIDIGMSASVNNLSRNNLSESTFNSTFSHLAFAAPVSRRSALSFGILPYSDLGYSYRNKVKIDTTSVDQLYEGEGGLSKAYLGYGYRFGDHLRIGGNLEYSSVTFKVPAQQNMLILLLVPIMPSFRIKTVLVV